METSVALKTIAPFEKIFIDEQSRNSKLVQRIISLAPPEKLQFIQGELKLGKFHSQKGDLTSEQFARSKRILHIKEFEGHFFKRCPGFSQKKALTCCNYHVLNLGQQCNFNCSYCYLQSYLNYPAMLIYSNIDRALLELKEIAELHGGLPFRVGTGEVIDSLSMDPLTLYSRELISFFRAYPKWTLELKTKSHEVDQFLDIEHAGNICVSWSINASEVIESEEHGTARLSERLVAARKVLKRGYRVAFHIDPMIFYPDWKTGYGNLVSQLADNFSEREVDLISLGTPRFQPEQRHMMRERFGMNSKIVRGEMWASEGGKYRYDAGLRREMFAFMHSEFRRSGRNWRTMLCMETPETWISQYSATPRNIDSVKQLWQPLPKLQRTAATEC